MAILDTKQVFHSHSHLRYESGIPVNGIQTCNRDIVIEKNINGCNGYKIKPGDGYIVSIINCDGPHPMWGDNYQMAPKPMRIVRQSDTEILLRGYQVLAQAPFGWIDYDLSDYGITLCLNNGTIQKCVLHMYDRDINLEYYL